MYDFHQSWMRDEYKKSIWGILSLISLWINYFSFSQTMILFFLVYSMDSYWTTASLQTFRLIVEWSGYSVLCDFCNAILHVHFAQKYKPYYSDKGLTICSCWPAKKMFLVDSPLYCFYGSNARESQSGWQSL